VDFASDEDGANDDACGGAKREVTRGFLGHLEDIVIGEYVMK
jgi:hypothetical protein